MNKPYKADTEERIYKIEGVGEFPSVTTIIGQLDKSGPLMGWAVKMVIEYLQQHKDDLAKDPTETFKQAKAWYKQLQQQALDLGSELHNCIEVYLKGQKIDGILEVHLELKGAFAEFCRWQQANNFQIVESEHIVWSEEYKFAGTLDCVAHLNGGALYLVDFKSSKAIYPEYLMQIAAYKVAYEERTGKKIEKLGILRLPKIANDTFEWREYTLEQADNAFDEFMCLVSFWHEKKRNKKEEKNVTS